jgi:hypothetical protein
VRQPRRHAADRFALDVLLMFDDELRGLSNQDVSTNNMLPS